MATACSQDLRDRVLAAYDRGMKNKTGRTSIQCSTFVDGAVNDEVFESFVEQVMMSQLEPCDVVVMNNLSSHRCARMRDLIEQASATFRFLPPYSPDLNQIEMVFSKVKQLLRSLACRTHDALWKTMQSVLDQITINDAANCFKHCRYAIRTD